jgi:TATA-box binding protein (TBP) (component of TFIID and TFIIIB)
MQTLKMLYRNTGMQFRATNFSIINIVGAVSLNTMFNCESFAYNHSDEVRFDPRNFVGLTWKPTKLGVPIIVEVYSTGRANIPGATREHLLYNSFAKLIPELLRYSSASSHKQEHDDRFQEVPENENLYNEIDSSLYMGQLGNLSTRI